MWVESLHVDGFVSFFLLKLLSCCLVVVLCFEAHFFQAETKGLNVDNLNNGI